MVGIRKPNFRLTVILFLLSLGFAQQLSANELGSRETTGRNHTLVFSLPEVDGLYLEITSPCKGPFSYEAYLLIGNQSLLIGGRKVEDFIPSLPYPSVHIYIDERLTREFGPFATHDVSIPDLLQSLKGRRIQIETKANIKWQIQDLKERVAVDVSEVNVTFDRKPTVFRIGSSFGKGFDFVINLRHGDSASEEPLYSGKVQSVIDGYSFVLVHFYEQSLTIGGGPEIPLPGNSRDKNGILNIVARVNATEYNGLYYYKYDIMAYGSLTTGSCNHKNTDDKYTESPSLGPVDDKYTESPSLGPVDDKYTESPSLGPVDDKYTESPSLGPVDDKDTELLNQGPVYTNIIWGVIVFFMLIIFGIFTSWMMKKHQRLSTGQHNNTQHQNIEEEPMYDYVDLSRFALSRDAPVQLASLRPPAHPEPILEGRGTTQVNVNLDEDGYQIVN